jgi:hypothetical protein
MWIALTDGFVSIVEAEGPPGGNGQLVVRARQRPHLVRFFGGQAGVRRLGIKIERTPTRDYLFRAVATRRVVADRVREIAFGISYRNFKDACRDERLHRMYALWWADHQKLQPQQPIQNKGMFK